MLNSDLSSYFNLSLYNVSSFDLLSSFIISPPCPASSIFQDFIKQNNKVSRNYNIMMQRFNFLLVVILIASTHQDNNCKNLIDSWLKHPETLPAIVYTNSGKFLNDLGDYNNCLYNKDQYQYFTITVINKVARGIQNMGLCAPLDCSEQIASNKYSKKIEDQLNQAFRNATNTTLVPFVNLNIYNPDKNKPQMDWSNYTVIAVFAILIFLGLVGSVVGLVSKSESKPIRALKSFSFYENFRKIVAIPKTVQNQNLLFINGLRVLSISWIIYGHNMWLRFGNMKNWTESLDIFTTPGITTLTTATYFAVDPFFWIGSFLSCMALLEQLKQIQQTKKMKSFSKYYIGIIVHRIIRIWPTYMVALFFYWKVAPYIGDGPIWRNFYNMTKACDNGGFLWNMFFIDNFGYHGPMGLDYCFGWGWYMAVDFQMFLITPFVIYAYHRNKKMGWIISFSLFLASLITAFVLIVVKDWRYPIANPKLPPQPQFMDEFYYKPYIRVTTYMMGIFTGFIYVEWKSGNEFYVNIINKIKNSVFIRVCFYVVGIFLCESMIWVLTSLQKGDIWSTTTQAFYNSFNRIIFVIGVFLVCFGSMFGCKHDPTKYIVGHWLFAPLAKVSFCMYLTHFMVILYGIFSVRMDLYFQPSSSIYLIISDIFFSILAGTFLSLLIEAPILGLQRVFLRGDKSKGKQKQNKLQLNKSQQLQQPLKDSFETSVESVEINTINSKQISLQNVKVSPQLDNTMIL